MSPTRLALLASLIVLFQPPPAQAQQASPKAKGAKMEQLEDAKKKGMHGMHGMKRMHGMMMGYGKFILSKADELKLSDEQTGKIYRISMAREKSRNESMGGMHKGMMELHGMFVDPSVSEADIRATAKKQSAAWDAMIEAAIVERNEVNALLTPDQLKQVKTMKPDMPMHSGMSMDEGE